MKPTSVTRKILRVIGITLGSLVVILACFHWWFINHAEEIVEDLVHTQSKGKVSLQVKNFKFNWFSRKMELHNAVFYSTDTLTAPASYKFEVRRLKIQVKAVWPIILEKRFYIDSLHLFDPQITVTRLRPSIDSLSNGDTTSLSLPQEMGRVYHSIQDALQVLEVDRFQIDNGKFTLVNKVRKEQPKVQVTNIYFHLDNLQVDSTSKDGKEKILFSDNVALQTHHQDILFPDGRHRLSFANFRINIKNKMAEFDSCTISATKNDSANASFRIFFDKLRMTNIDFDTLYHAEVIKADSVYCINPRFRLDVDLEKRTGPVKPPKLDELIQQMTGDMQVSFVVVQNGSFDINTMREGRPSSFVSHNNNFELKGLRIRQKAAKPFVVDRFAMAIRNYENFLRDSAFSIQFDSILINNNRISLANFKYEELKDNKKVNQVRMPQFELYGLSWDDLVFEQQLRANQVTLYQPVINYNLGAIARKNNPDVFEALASVGKILQLNNFAIVNGEVNLQFRNNAKLQLKKASTTLRGQALVASRKVSGIRESVETLHFEKGLFTMGDVKAELDEVSFSGASNHMAAGRLRISDKDKFVIDADNAEINSMIVDEKLNQVHIAGLRWNKANIRIDSLSESNSRQAPTFIVSGLDGRNTTLEIIKGQQRITANLQSVKAGNISVRGKKIEVNSPVLVGTDLSIQKQNTQAVVGSFHLQDNQVSVLKDISYTSTIGMDSTSIQVPEISFSALINDLVNGNINANSIRIASPVIKLRTNREGDMNSVRRSFPQVSLQNIEIEQPDIDISSITTKGKSGFRWPAQEGNRIEINGIRTIEGRQLEADRFGFVVDQFAYATAKGKKFESGKGHLEGKLASLRFQQSDAGNWDWQGIVKSLNAQRFQVDSIGKESGTLKIGSANIQDLALNSSWLLSLRELVKNNHEFKLDHLTGDYRDSTRQVSWYNAGYHKKEKRFSLDSFFYKPTKDLKQFLATEPYQADYLSGYAKLVESGPFDIDRFVRDSVLDIGTLSINDAYVDAFRDKRIPREPGIVRPLLVNMIRKIPVRLKADTILVNRSMAVYEEVNEKTGVGGRIEVNRLNGRITGVRNYDLVGNDSLRITASARLNDEIPTYLYVRESYSDPEGGFLMDVQMGSSDLTSLNPILGALASADLRSGILDTMTMVVRGHRHSAQGSMEMRYRDLKVRVIRSKGNKKGTTSGFSSFLANTLIRNRNTNRTGVVYFKRLKDRSAINYLVKITMSGVVSSVGINKTKKELKRENREKSRSGRQK